jgi:hypothetical protein
MIHAGTPRWKITSTATVAGRTAYKVVSEARTNKTMDVIL